MRNRLPIPILALIISLAAALTYNYVTQVERPNLDSRLELHSQIIDREAPSPYGYRVLVPWVTEAVAVIASMGDKITYIQAWQVAYGTYDFVSIALFLITLFILLRTWYSDSLSAVGVFFCAALLPLSLRDHYFQPWSLVEAWFFCLAFLLSHRKRFPLLILVTALASLNRATGLFIPLIYFLGAVELRWLRKGRYRQFARPLLKSVILLAVALTVIAVVRLHQGHHAHIHTIAYFWHQNTAPATMTRSVIHWGLFLGAGWFMILWGWKEADSFLRRQMIAVLSYLVPVILFGFWYEVRLLLPLYPVLIALILQPIHTRLAN